jgi:hypothetical protein
LDAETGGQKSTRETVIVGRDRELKNRRQEPRRNGPFSIDDGFRGSGRLDGGGDRYRTVDPRSISLNLARNLHVPMAELSADMSSHFRARWAANAVDKKKRQTHEDGIVKDFSALCARCVQQTNRMKSGELEVLLSA